MDDNIKPKKKIINRKSIYMGFLCFLIGVMTLGFLMSVINLSKTENVLINTIGGHDKIDEPIDEPKDDPKDDNKKEDEEPVDNRNIIFSYYEIADSSNGINLADQYPVDDEVGKAFVGDNRSFEFKISFNEDALGITYYIVAEKILESDLDEGAVKVHLESNSREVSSTINFETGKVKVFSDYPKYDKDNQNERLIYTNKITKEDILNKGIEFKLRMWISNEVEFNETICDKTFKLRINVYAKG